MTRLGLVGLGKWGKNYVDTISQMSGCTLTHICASSKSTLAAFPHRFKKTTRYQDLIKYKSEIDGVIIATPANSHFTIARDFITHGIAVLLEKPFTTNLKDALTLEKLAGQYNIPVMVGHEYLYNSAFTTLKSSLRMLGKISYIQTEAGNWGPFRNDASVLWDWGPHDMSMLIDIVNELPNSVEAWGVADDVVYARLNFDQIVALMNLNRRLPEKVRKMIIAGDNKSLMYDELAKQKLKMYSNEGFTNIRYRNIAPLEREVEAFVSLIETRELPKTHVGHAVSVIRILDALERSLKENQPVNLD